jgi:hypothetical protein
MNELTEGWTLRAKRCSKNKSDVGSVKGKREGKKRGFTSETKYPLGCSKKVKKKFDDLVTILIVCQTSADASRYASTVKAAGLTNR